jgi:DNA repair protein RadA/Sms
MAQKPKVRYICQVCGHEALKWQGKCEACGNWNSFVEEYKEAKGKTKVVKEKFPPETINQIKLDEGAVRLKTNIKELDLVLGGGIVLSSAILIGGEPGIGKSTLTLQLASSLTNPEARPILYVSGEESIRQLKLRASRLGIFSDNIYLYQENNLELILEELLKLKPILVIIDSIQTIYTSSLVSSPGSVAQVRETTAALTRAIKEQLNPPGALVIIGHITKYGAIAGPKTLEHIVDVVLYFEGEKVTPYRILRATKNRFGSSDEIGVFEMTEKGLLGCENPSYLFLGGSLERTERIGSIFVPTKEGSRAFLLEIQALTAPSYYHYPQRVSTGYDPKRLAMLLCILERHCDLNILNHDVFINTMQGIKIEESACDLGVAIALASAYLKRPVSSKTAVVGEVSLAGEVRPVIDVRIRVREAQKLGFNKVLIPEYNLTSLKKEIKDIDLVGVRDINYALEVLSLKK